MRTEWTERQTPLVLRLLLLLLVPVRSRSLRRVLTAVNRIRSVGRPASDAEEGGEVGAIFIVLWRPLRISAKG